ncbi:hypothetical protein [Actinocrispum wychmicini]|uniref:Uncharacterized protein n=1 Tax=Actinocrispum wychmicini TaxID=1213861 RepID=A0A4R2JCB5_9PSEU|nr:hypothetical protein [Actinocrispum wychmicini]TCO55642.1 hypothetical protein EV192_10764 [Actinocrispum wychmicini]
MAPLTKQQQRQQQQQDDMALFTDEGLASMAKWAAGGFTLLTGVLTVLGFEGGALMRLVTADPVPAIFVFILVGLGTLCGLLSVAVEKKPIQVPVVIGGIIVIGGLAMPILPNVADQTEKLWVNVAVIVVFAVLVAVSVKFRSRHLPWSAALVIVAVAVIGLGVYGAVKVAVVSRIVDNGASVSAELGNEARPVLKLHVKTTLPPNINQLDLQVLAINGGDKELLRVNLPSDNSGEIDQTISVPITLGNGATDIVVRHCPDDACKQNMRDIVRFSGLTAPPPPQQQ